MQKKLGPTTYQVITPGLQQVLHVNLLREWLIHTEKAALLLIRCVGEDKEADHEYLPPPSETDMDLTRLTTAQE